MLFSCHMYLLNFYTRIHLAQHQALPLQTRTTIRSVLTTYVLPLLFHSSSLFLRFPCNQDDAFGPFADSAAASGTDPFTFSPTISDDLEDAAGFDAFGTEFGEFHAATGAPSGDGETTPTAESWSFTSGSSSGLTDSAEDFGLGSENQAQEEKMKEGSRTAATRETK